MEMEDSTKIIITEPVFAYLRPTILFMRLFGIAPVSYDLVKNHYLIEKSLKYTIYSFILVMIFGTGTILGLISDASAEHSIRMKVQEQKLIVMSDIGIVVCSVLFGVCMSPYKIKSLLKVLRCLNQIHKEINLTKENMKEERQVALMTGLTVYAVFISVFVLDIFVWLERCETNYQRFSYIKDYSFFYVLYLVVMSQELSFCNFTYYIKKKIMAVNMELHQEIQRNSEVFLVKQKSGKTVEINVEQKQHSDSRRDVLENYLLKNNVYSSMNGSRSDRISSLLKVHSFIFNAVISINDCFGYPLLFIMISCLLHLVVTPFFLITGPHRKPLFILLQVCWILVHLGRLLIIVEPTHRCIQEHEKTNPLIVHLLSIVEEQEMRQKLEVFATQGQLCVIQFSPCGIVTIRRSLLASIAGAVTTYLVIMIQLNEGTTTSNDVIFQNN